MFKNFLNTFCIPRIHNKIFSEGDYQLFFKENRIRTYHKIFARLFYFYPRIFDAKEWFDGGENKKRDFNQYLEYRKCDLVTLNKICKLSKNLNDKILDIGCNNGRHIRYLNKRGYTNLFGVDAMSAAIEYCRTNSPSINPNNLNHDLIQRFLFKQENLSFDITYTIGATIELIHPSFDIISHMCRVTKEYIFLLIGEDHHAYPRFYRYEIKKNNFEIVDIKLFDDNYNKLLICKRSN
jgi:SAM-dependent methyltransferase